MTELTISDLGKIPTFSSFFVTYVPWKKPAQNETFNYEDMKTMALLDRFVSTSVKINGVSEGNYLGLELPVSASETI